MKRRGDVTSWQVFAFVSVLIGLAIVLFFLGEVFSGSDSAANSELCRLSILTRATSPDPLQAAVPLKCTTGKICFTSGLAGKCTQFAGEKDVTRIHLKGDGVAMAQTISSYSAEAMRQCWEMTGQGKLDIFGRAATSLGLDSSKASCIICSRLAIAGDVPDDVRARVKMDDYLRNTQVPGKPYTYLQEFLGNRGTNSYTRINDTDLSSSQTLISTFDGNQIAFVFMQIKPVDFTKALENQALAVEGAAFLIPGASKIGKAILFTPAGRIVGAVAAVAAVGVAAVNTYEGQQAAAGYCGTFTSNTGAAEKGCSVVQGISYTVKDVNSLCENIQGTP